MTDPTPVPKPVSDPTARGKALPSLGGSPPRYQQLAQTLLNEIGSGRYPVGSQLPTEFELCEQFGVSRSTAREALKRLVQLGLVVRQARIGTTVKSTASVPGYRQLTADVADLHQYATDTTLVIEPGQTRQINAAEAEMLEASAGETWLHLQGLRRATDEARPICHTELWLHPAFRAIQGIEGPLRGSVYGAIEQQFGEVVTSVEQEIRAVAIAPHLAEPLQVPDHSPGLWVCRKYRNHRDELIELAISVHPADRFSHTSILRREWAGDATREDKTPARGRSP